MIIFFIFNLSLQVTCKYGCDTDVKLDYIKFHEKACKVNALRNQVSPLNNGSSVNMNLKVNINQVLFLKPIE